MADDPKQVEPDMDEILTSIRRIIAEGDFPASDEGAASGASNAFQAVPRIAEPREEILHLTDKIQDGQSSPAEEDISSRRAARVTRDEEFLADSQATAPAHRRGAGAETFYEDAPGTGSGPDIAESLEAIASLIGAKEAQRGGGRDDRLLEDLAVETLRREIKSWLDENLPRLVERVVREEIENLLRLAGTRR